MTGLRDSTGQALPPIESPSEEKLRVYGDMLFLAFRSDRHRRMTTATMRAWLEPPVELGQFRVFRIDGVPRGMYTWAWLSPEAGRRMIAGEALAPGDWRSGETLWLMDMIAPYRGMAASMVRFVMTKGHFTDRDFHFRRVTGDNTTRRIVHVDFRRAELARVLSDADFAEPPRPAG